MSSIDAAFYTCPTSGAVYVVKTLWGELEHDTNAQDWEPLQYAGPLSPEQVVAIATTEDTSGLGWHEDLPDDMDLWEQGKQLWVEPYETWED